MLLHVRHTGFMLTRLVRNMLSCRPGQRTNCRAIGSVRPRFCRTAFETLQGPVSSDPEEQDMLPEDTLEDNHSNWKEQGERQRDWMERDIACMNLRDQPGKWKSYACIIVKVPVGARYVSIRLASRDTGHDRYQSGSHGVRFAKPCLTWIAAEHCSNHCACSIECLHASFGPTGFSCSLHHP